MSLKLTLKEDGSIDLDQMVIDMGKGILCANNDCESEKDTLPIDISIPLSYGNSMETRLWLCEDCKPIFECD